jgi:hypothetical protein
VRRLGSVVLLIASLALPAHADWPAQGKRVLVPHGYEGSGGVWMVDLPSGDMIVRADGYTHSTIGFVVQHITPGGEFASGWPVEGVSFGPGPSVPSAIGFTVDQGGFCWQTAGFSGSSACALDPGGVLEPAGSPWALTSTAFSFPTAFVPARGGIYAFVSNHVQRFTEAGVRATGWPADGVTAVGNAVGNSAALADGSGGVVVMAASTALGPRTTHVDSSAVKHGGTFLSDDVDDSNAPYDERYTPPLPALLPSDASHYFAVWSAPARQTVQYVKVQRAGFDNALAPGWPTAGIVAVAPDTIFHVTPLPDHAGGLYLVWYQSDGLPRATHVRADGTFVPGTDANGVVLYPPGPMRDPQVGFNGGGLPYMIADVTPDGRLLFAWDDVASGNGIRVQWLLPDLTADPSEPVAGRLIVPNPEKTYVLAVHAAPDGGAYVAWESAFGPIGFPETTYEVWMTRLLPSSLVGVTPPAPRAALALSAPRPNPARGSVALDVTLPDDSPARVELLDVAGRVVRSQSVQSAGAHALSFRELTSLSPGLYFARVSGRAGNVTARVVVSR